MSYTSANPFTPGFGQQPAVLAGRREILRRWDRAFATGSGHDPATRTLLLDERGVGKTVLLDDVHDIALAHGWLVVEESGGVRGPLVDRLVGRIWTPDDVAETSTRLGVHALGLKAERRWERPAAPMPASLRDAVSSVLGSIQPPGTGLLVTIDEVHDVATDDIKTIGNELQQLLRSGYRVALVAAGLPVDDLVDHRRMPTFLARSWQPELGPVSDADVAEAFTATLATIHATCTSAALARAVDAAAGLPYAMQLVGWYMVDDAPPDTTRFELEHVRSVTGRVHSDLLTGLRLPYDVSPGRRSVLEAMAHDDGPSRLSDLTRRLGKTPQQIAPVRAWLLERGYVDAPARGLLEFRHSGMRALLRTDPDALARDPQRRPVHTG